MVNAISSGMSTMNFGPMRGVQGGQGKDDLFTKVDSNQDGSLDESEVASFADKMSEMTGQSSDAAEMMAMFDSDEDGAVSESEFASARPQGPPPPMMGGMQEGSDPFASVDEDSDGSLSASELTTFAEKMTEMTGQTMDATKLMTSLDSDEDGAISADEFKAGKPQGPPPPPPGGMMPPGGTQASDSTDETSSIISSLDSDGDGSVSEDEFKVGLNTLIQEYMNQSFSTGEYASSSGGLLSVEA